MMLTQETPAPSQTARRRIDWAKLFWLMKKQPADADRRRDYHPDVATDGAVALDNALRSQCH